MRRPADRASGDTAEFIRCRLCRRPFRQMTQSHLYWKHGLETADYAERFPQAPFMASDTLRRHTDAIVAVWERLGRHWTRDRVKRDIGRIRGRTRPLHARGVKETQPSLFGAAMRLYGSWEAALRDAGIDPQSIRRRRGWDESSLLAAIRAARAGARHTGSFRSGRWSLVQAAAARWGSWRAALGAAGLAPLRPASVRWTREEVVKRIRDRARRGEPLLASHVHNHAPGLKRAAERLFGKPWSDLLRGLGIPYLGRERWTAAKIVRQFRRRNREGKGLTCMIVRRENRALAQAAARHFKSWTAALEAAGLSPRAVHGRHWSREELVRLLARLQRRGPLSRRRLRSVRRRGYVNPESSLRRYWKSLAEASALLP